METTHYSVKVKLKGQGHNGHILKLPCEDNTDILITHVIHDERIDPWLHGQSSKVKVIKDREKYPYEHDRNKFNRQVFLIELSTCVAYDERTRTIDFKG